MSSEWYEDMEEEVVVQDECLLGAGEPYSGTESPSVLSQSKSTERKQGRHSSSSHATHETSQFPSKTTSNIVMSTHMANSSKNLSLRTRVSSGDHTSIERLQRPGEIKATVKADRSALFKDPRFFV